MNGNFEDDTAIQNEQERNKSGVLQGVDQFSSSSKSGFNADRGVYGEKEKGSPKGLNGLQDDKINKHDQADIDSINKRGKNETDINGKKKKGEEDDTSSQEKSSDKKSDLEKKDDKTDEKKEKEKKEKEKKDKEKKIEVTKKNKSKLLLKIKIYFWIIVACLGILLIMVIISYLILAIDSFIGAITTNYGVQEQGDEETGKDGLYTDEKYIKDENDEYRDWEDYVDEDGNKTEGLITVLEKEVKEKCNVDSDFMTWWDSLSSKFNNGKFSDVCALLRFVKGNIKDYEERYSVNVDDGLIIAVIFYSYDEQAMYRSYEEVNDEEVIQASDHYGVLTNIVENGLITTADIERIIMNSIFDQVYPYFVWRIETVYEGGETDGDQIDPTSDDFNDSEVSKKVIGHCDQNKTERYFPSLDKEKMFIRWNDERDGELKYQNKDNLNQPKTPEARVNKDFSVPGYMAYSGGSLVGEALQSLGITKAKVLERRASSGDALGLYGSGWVYDNNMNDSWNSTSVECNGSLTEAEVLAMHPEVDSLSSSVSTAHNFYKDREIEGVVDTTIYFQKVEDPYSMVADAFESRNIKYTISDGAGGIKTTSDFIEFDYKHGYGYIDFQGFKRAIDNPNIKGFVYDPIKTPKQLEVVIMEIVSRKDEYSEILLLSPEDENIDPTTGLVGFGGVVGAYCDEYLTANTANINVEITDCSGNPITTISFADYVMGVTYAEIGNLTNEQYILTQMVAAASYALGRNNNYQNGSTIRMRSGSCDQNWCSITEGCYRHGTPGTNLLSTYPGKGTWKSAMSASDQAKYLSLYNVAAGYLIVDKSSNKIRSGSYYGSQRQAAWEAATKEGKDFIEILQESYPDSTLIDCTNISPAITEGNSDFNDVDVQVPNPSENEADWGKRIVDMATDLVNNHNKDFCYVSPGVNDQARINTYNDIKTNGFLHTDCNGFVGYVIHHALGIGPDIASSDGDVKFAAPSGSSWYGTKSCVKTIASGLTLDQALSKASPGDLLASNGDGGTHIQIFAGNGTVIDNANAGGGSSCGHPLAFRTKNGSGYKIRHQNGSYTILRITSLSC